MASWVFCVVLFVYIHKGSAQTMTKNFDNYGPYTVEWEHYDPCQSGKAVKASTYTTTLIKEQNDTFRGILNVTLPENVRVEEIKIMVYTLKEGKKTQLWNYNVNKPCQHYMLATVLEAYFQMKNCQMKKGFYYVDLPLSALMVNYIGTSFFYGDYIFKVIVNSKNANICCLLFDPKFKKKVSH